MSGGERPVGVDASAGQGVQAGDHNAQVNDFSQNAVRQEVSVGRDAYAVAGDLTVNNYAAPAGEPEPRVVVGDVPQEPAAFQLRTGLMEALEGPAAGRVRVVFAVTGIRGVGKTQVAAAYARRRMAAGWRLVAWVDASDEASVLAGLGQVAAAVGVGAAGEDARVLAGLVRHWLEADGERRLLVFDNALDLDGMRPFLPAGGAAQVIVTSSRRSAGGLGAPVPVDVFSQGEALAFLGERTGLADEAGAREVAEELGWLPLGLAQAAALIAREGLDYATYLGRLRSLPVAAYVRRADGDPYRYRLAEAVTLSLAAAEADDGSGVRAGVMGLVAVLAETGVSRRLLHLAAETGVLGAGPVGAGEVDAGVGDLADASLLGFTGDGGSVLAHRLVMRVARERLAADGALSLVLCGAIRVLGDAVEAIGEPLRDRAWIRELTGQVNAVIACMEGHPGGDATAHALSVYLLNELNEKNALATSLAAGELLAEYSKGRRKGWRRWLTSNTHP